MKKGIIAVLVILGILIVWLYSANRTSSDVVYIYNGEKEIPVFVELADNTLEKYKGLIGRESLDENRGMLFIYGNEQIRSVWMKNMLIPLDIIFIDENKVIVDIKENIQPCQADCPSYSSQAPAMYFLEVNAGFVEKNRIEKGNAVKFII